MFDHVVVWPGQLLNHIAQRRLDWRPAEIPAQSAVGDDVNARHLRAARIEGDVVRFRVIERGSCTRPLLGKRLGTDIGDTTWFEMPAERAIRHGQRHVNVRLAFHHQAILCLSYFRPDEL